MRRLQQTKRNAGLHLLQHANAGGLQSLRYLLGCFAACHDQAVALAILNALDDLLDQLHRHLMRIARLLWRGKYPQSRQLFLSMRELSMRELNLR